MDETFSSIDLVTQCLLDTERTDKFDQAIKRAVNKDSIVVDAGTGSGILSLFAARAGAKKVYSIEFDPYVAKLALNNVKNNNFSDVIHVINGDARNIFFDDVKHFDVVIMEMLTTGMIDEYQIWTINRLHQQGYVNSQTTFIPFKQDTGFTLAFNDYSDHGLSMRMVKHYWKFLPNPRIEHLSDCTLLNSVQFNQTNDINHDSEHTVEIKNSGIINSIYLTSRSWLDKDLSVDDTLALNAPVCFPLDNDIEVEKGDKIRVKISYMFGNGFRNFKVIANKI